MVGYLFHFTYLPGDDAGSREAVMGVGDVNVGIIERLRNLISHRKGSWCCPYKRD
jgi:hypothetical protein